MNAIQRLIVWEIARAAKAGQELALQDALDAACRTIARAGVAPETQLSIEEIKAMESARERVWVERAVAWFREARSPGTLGATLDGGAAREEACLLEGLRQGLEMLAVPRG